MVASVTRIGATVDAIDGFCGFGGSSQGIAAAGAEIRVAFNHDPLAIECHAANYPRTNHLRADLVDHERADYLDPADLPAARFAWFSPGCTHHSPANAQKLYGLGRQALLFDLADDFDEAAYAKSERSRVTMSCVLRYISRNRPEIGVVENVVEVTKWGPGRDGSTFKWWLRELKLLGYEVECCFFNSQFFPPCPQSRDRIYIVFWRKGNQRPDLDYRPVAYCTSERCGGRHVNAVQSFNQPTTAWPLLKWGKYDRQYIYRCPDCLARVEPAAWPAYTAINWANLGPAIHERAALGLRPLADKTFARLRRAVAKFHGFPPLLLPAKSVWGVDRPVSYPCTTQTTQQDKALVCAGLVPQRTNVLARAALEQANSLTTAGGGGHALLTAALVPQRGVNVPCSVGEQCNTLTAHGDQAVASVMLPAMIELRGGGSVECGQHPVFDAAQTVTAGGSHHGLMSMPLIRNGQDNDCARSAIESAFTMRAGGGSLQLLTPALFAKFNGGPGDTAWHTVCDPFNTVTQHDTHGLIFLPWFDQFGADPATVTRELAVQMPRLRDLLAACTELPRAAVTDEDLMLAHFRMLEPDPELRRVMAFGEDYILLGNKTQKTAGLGNAVTPPVASWITERCLATLRGESGGRNGRVRAGVA